MSDGHLPRYSFHIGESNSASLSQLPAFRPMAIFAVNKKPMPLSDGTVDITQLGAYPLGVLIADALFKLMRPWPLPIDQWFLPGTGENYIDDIGDSLKPLSPQTEGVRYTFLSRVCELLDISLRCPDKLPSILANIDALTNERLACRAHSILLTGVDPGYADLWVSVETSKQKGICHE